MSLANFSIRRPVTTAMFFLAVSLLGLISLGRLQVELMPEVVYPEIFVTISQQGMSPEQIERDLVMPVEEEVGQLLGVVEMTSAAALNRGNHSFMFFGTTLLRTNQEEIKDNKNKKERQKLANSGGTAG